MLGLRGLPVEEGPPTFLGLGFRETQADLQVGVVGGRAERGPEKAAQVLQALRARGQARRGRHAQQPLQALRNRRVVAPCEGFPRVQGRRKKPCAGSWPARAAAAPCALPPPCCRPL